MGNDYMLFGDIKATSEDGTRVLLKSGTAVSYVERGSENDTLFITVSNDCGLDEKTYEVSVMTLLCEVNAFSAAFVLEE